MNYGVIRWVAPMSRVAALHIGTSGSILKDRVALPPRNIQSLINIVDSLARESNTNNLRLL